MKNDQDSTRVVQATEVRKILDRFEEQDWNRHTANSYETVEEFAERVVEDGTVTPDVKITADLDLTLKERLTGRREQKLTSMVILGLMLGTALERDIPMDSPEEIAWRNGDAELP